ncbi:MAG TPA: glycosyl hydrolase family 28-related protein, partial [Pyrinomonadaceae bacterium]|nr:glycosyl hydrolase family 28-related protein [Pyrinomonadaceae bacterium]
MKTGKHFAVALVAALALAILGARHGTRFSATAAAVDANGYNVKSFGAVGDGKTHDTAAINKAIE